MLLSLIPPLVLAAVSQPQMHDAEHAEHDVGCQLHWHNLFGVKAIVVAAVPHDEPSEVEGQGGFGLLYERTLIRGWLELEVSANALFLADGRGAHLPVDVLLKKPFHFGHIVDPYVGIGAAVTVALGEEQFVAPGVIGTLGAYFWVHPRFGVLGEVDYAAVAEPERWQHEIEVSSGAVFRF